MALSSVDQRSSAGSAEPILDPDAEVLWAARARRPLALGLLGIAYFATGWAGLQTPQIGENVTLLWPPTGIAIFTLARFGRQAWPTIAVAAFALNAAIGTPLAASLGIALGNTLAPLLAVSLFVFWPLPRPLDGVLGSLRIMVISAGSMIVSAVIGTASLVFGGLLEAEAIERTVAGWWLGDAIGAVLVGSLLLSFRPSTVRALRTSRGAAHYFGSAGIVAVTSAAAFYGDGILPFVFLALLALTVIGMREPRFTSASAATTGALVAVVATAHGMGPFARDSIQAAMPTVISYVGALVVLQGVVQGMVRDHAALISSEVEKRRLLEANPDSVMVVGLDGRILDVNQKACENFGQARLRLLGRQVSDFDRTGTPELVASLVRRAIDEGAFTFETEHLDRNGAPYPVEIHVSPYVLGGMDCAVAASRDITGRKAQERKQRENELRLQAIFENEPECVKTVDRGCRLLDMNPAGLRMVAAASIDDVRGLDVRAMVAPPYREAFAEGVRDVFEGRTTFQVFEIIALDGTHRWMEQHAAPLPAADGSGEIAEMLAVTRDISERKEAERRLFQKHRVEALGSLAGGIAHDLNNTLSPVLLSVDGLYERLGRNDPVVATVDRSTERAVEMIRHLLNFARGTEGEHEEVDAFDLLADLEDIVAATFPQNIRFSVEAPDELPTLLADANQLHQVFVNLCLNARDAMPEGGDLQIRVSPVDAGADGLDGDESTGGGPVGSGRFLVFDVEDSGTGIPTKIRDKIFEPFFSTKQANKGTGLGLASASGTIGNHGGAIQLASSEMGGARFRVFLPALDRIARASDRFGAPRGAKLEAALEQVSHGPTSEAQGRVLLVDDEQAVREVAEQALQRLGYEVHSAGDAREALALYDQIGEIDAVVTDLRMPGMGGDELIGKLRRRDAALPVILTSGHMEEAGEALSEAGASREVVRLHKPFRVRALRDALERARSASAPPAA